MQAPVPKILLVDDTRLDIEIMKSLLCLDYEIHTATNGLEALEIARSKNIDLILLDVLMPVMDGHETCERLKSDPATEKIPVIFITGQGEVQEEIKGLALGAIDYIIKPISGPILKARVRNHLQLKQYRDSLEKLHGVELFRNTFEMAAVGIAHVSPTGRFLRVNRILCSILGYSHEELMLLTFQEITYPDDLDADLTYMHKLLAGEIQTYAMNKRYTRKNGEIIWANLTGSLVRHSEGIPEYFIAVVEDISERKQLELELYNYKNHLERLVAERTERLVSADVKVQQLSIAVEQSPVSVVITETDGSIVYVNPKFSELTGYGPEEILGANPRILKSDITPLATYADLWKTLKSGRLWQGEFCNRKKSGVFYWESASIKPLLDEQGVVTHYVGVKEDITQRKQTDEKLRELSLTDELTSLSNRRGFTLLAEQQIKLSLRLNKGFTIFFADLDGMKGINDTFGHQEGDQALRDIATLFMDSFRASDILARIGGDEFAGLSVDTLEQDADAIIARLRERMDTANATLSRPYKLSLSIGTAEYDPAFPCTLTELLEKADREMYAEKNSKKKQSEG